MDGTDGIIFPKGQKYVHETNEIYNLQRAFKFVQIPL